MKSAVGGESTARKKKTATKKPAGEKTKSVIAKKKTGKACGEGVKKRVRKKEEEEMEEDSGVGEGEKEEKGEKTVKVVEKRTLRARAPAAKPRYTVSLLCVCVFHVEGDVLIAGMVVQGDVRSRGRGGKRRGWEGEEAEKSSRGRRR